MNNESKYINDILIEACLDERVDSGIIDFNNITHREVIAEGLFDLGLDESVIVEIVNSLAIRDGKYPDRQAYNKEGWLVTFPSPEYKQAAIKRGTHFGSDPTHGKGGMNVYYKRKGKQKRVAQQDVSSSEPSQTSQSSSSPTQPTQPPTQSRSQSPSNQRGEEPVGNAAPSQKDSVGGSDSALPQSSVSGGDDTEDVKTTQSVKDYEAGPRGGEKPKQDGRKESPPLPVPSAPPVASFVNVSVEFAKGKQWNPTPFGEWRNAVGDTTAVVGLSGEVVPIKTTDREELKLFSAKKQP